MRIVPEIHRLRGVAIVLVVIGHCQSHVRFKHHDIVNLASRVLFRNGTLLFVFITGFLFWHLHHNGLRYRDYLHKKWRSVALPYLVWSTPIIALMTMGVLRQPHTRLHTFGLPVLSQGWWLLTGAHVASFWYVPMIFLFFLATPLLRVWGNSRVFIWTLPLSVAVSLLLERTARSHELFPPLVRAGHFLSVFAIGMAVARWHAPVMQFVARRWRWLAAAAAVVAFAHVVNHGSRNYNYVQKLLLLGPLLLALARLPEGWVTRVLDALAHYSFGLFFVHETVLRAVAYRKWRGDLGLLGLSLSVIAVSIVVVVVVARLSGRHSRAVCGVEPVRAERGSTGVVPHRDRHLTGARHATA